MGIPPDIGCVCWWATRGRGAGLLGSAGRERGGGDVPWPRRDIFNACLPCCSSWWRRMYIQYIQDCVYIRTLCMYMSVLLYCTLPHPSASGSSTACVSKYSTVDLVPPYSYLALLLHKVPTYSTKDIKYNNRHKGTWTMSLRGEEANSGNVTNNHYSRE